MGKTSLLALGGLVAGLLTWILIEPFAPKAFGDPAWAGYSFVIGATLGILIGLALGLISGYFQGSRRHMIIGALSGIGVGFVGGLMGLGLGNMIYTSVQGLGFIGEVVGRIAGWAIFGALIGLGQGVVGMSMKRAYYGLIGGILGGGAGGGAFLIVGSVTAIASMSGDAGTDTGSIPRGIAYAVLGLGIGLMIGVVESIGRKAWVRLMLGRNEGKDWALDATETYLGRSEGVHIPLFGDPNVQPNHACIRIEKGQYALYDLQTPIGIAVNGYPTRQALLNHGDTFQIGQHTLMFMLRGAAKPTYMTQPQISPYVPEPIHSGYAQVPAGFVNTLSQPTVAQASVSFPTLVALDGPLAGQRYQVTGPADIGREQPIIPLAFDTQASRRHARIEPAPGGMSITDLGSKNGVYVNDFKISTTIAKIGDLLRIGSTTFRLE